MIAPLSSKSVLALLLAPWLLMTTAATATSLPTTELCIADHPHQITAEVADTDRTRARGLMMRAQLAEHSGMWFRYQSERPGSNGFWMYNTWIALDIAYLDAQQRIVAIIQMQPCESIDPSRCPVYQPNVPYHSALEMNLGYFAKHNLTLGAQVTECADSSNKQQ